MGGLVARGFPGGHEIVKEVGAKYWISAHDERKDNQGWATTWIKSRGYTVGEVQGVLDGESGGKEGTRVVELGVGESVKTG